MSRKLKYPLPNDIDLTEDRIFRQRPEYRTFSKGLPWEKRSNDYLFYTSDNATTINLSWNTIDTTINELRSFDELGDMWINTSLVTASDANRSQIVTISDDTRSFRTRMSYTSNGNTYYIRDVETIHDDVISYGYYKWKNERKKLYSGLPFSPYDYNISRDEGNINLDRFKWNHKIPKEPERGDLKNFDKLKCKDLSRVIIPTINKQLLNYMSWFTDDEKDNSVLIPVLSEFEPEYKILSTPEWNREILHVDMDKFPWENRRHSSSRNVLRTINDQINSLNLNALTVSDIAVSDTTLFTV